MLVQVYSMLALSLKEGCKIEDAAFKPHHPATFSQYICTYVRTGIRVVLSANLGIEEWPDFVESHYRALARTAQLILAPDRFDGWSASLDRNRSRQG